MRSTLITGIGELTTCDGPSLADAALVLDGEQIAWTGPSRRAPAADVAVDVESRAVLQGWVDSHTHLIFAGDRSEEFADRSTGARYSAGGIMATVTATRAASDAELAATLRRLVAEALTQGTTCLETKTGYGLAVLDEQRSARIAAAVVDEVTFLGAHVVPPEHTAADYLHLVTGEMLDTVAPHVSWVDMFCERGAFDPDTAAQVLVAGRARGLGLRVQANQLGPGPEVRLAVEHGAASVDHCTYLSSSDVDALAASQTVATLLPTCDLSCRAPLPDARALLDAGVTVALATNCNPGSSYTTSMAFCVATAVLQMGMSIAEAIRAATLGGAQALHRTDVGILRPGARADIHVLGANFPVRLSITLQTPRVVDWSGHACALVTLTAVVASSCQVLARMSAARSHEGRCWAARARCRSRFWGQVRRQAQASEMECASEHSTAASGGRCRKPCSAIGLATIAQPRASASRTFTLTPPPTVSGQTTTWAASSQGATSGTQPVTVTPGLRRPVLTSHSGGADHTMARVAPGQRRRIWG